MIIKSLVEEALLTPNPRKKNIKMLTRAIVLALNLQHTFVSMSYPRPVQWDKTNQTFTVGKSSLGRLFPLILINVGIFLVITLSCTLYILFDGNSYPTKYPIIVTSIMFLYLSDCIGIPSVNLIFHKNPDDVIHYLNCLVEFNSPPKWCNSQVAQKKKMHKLVSRFPFKEFDGSLDTFGLLTYCCCACLAGANFIAPFMVVFTNMDPYYFVLRDILTYTHYPADWIRIVTILMRLLSIIGFVFETATLYQFGLCYLIIIIKEYKRILSRLGSIGDVNRFLLEYDQLRVIHSLGSETFSAFLTLCLGLLYFCAICVVTMTLLGFQQIPLEVYIFFPYFCVLIITSAFISVSIPSRISTQSQKRIQVWKDVINLSLHPNSTVRRKLILKILAGTPPLKFIYFGGAGHFQESTTITYLHSLFNNIVNAILTFKERFM